MIKKIGLVITAWLVSMQLMAAENTYTIFSLGYSDIDYSEEQAEGVGYKLGLGYQIAPQWYVEMGYQQLLNDSLYLDVIPTAAQFENNDNRMQGDALFVALLGKASSNVGELFYRLGVLKTDIRGQKLYIGDRACDVGLVTSVSVESLGNGTICDFDNSGAAGVFGLGFDYFIGARTMLRTEIEYIKGKDNLSITALFVGLRYNF